MNSDNNKTTERQSVAQQLIDEFTEDIPAALWETYSKVPNEKDIEWAKKVINNHVPTLPTDQLDLEAMAKKQCKILLAGLDYTDRKLYPIDDDSYLNGYIVGARFGYTANTTAQTTMDKVVAEIERRREFLQSDAGGYNSDKILCKNDFLISELTTLLTTLKKDI